MRRTHTLLWVFVLATLASLCAGAGSTASQALLLQALAHLDDEQLVALNRTMAVAVAARRASAAAPPALREAARAAVRRQLLQVIDVKSHSPTYAPTQSGVFEGGDQAIPELEGYMPPLGYEQMSPECNRVLNGWLAKCSVKVKSEWSLRESARKKWGYGSGYREELKPG